MTRRPPVTLAALAVLVAVVLLLPLAYLVIRASQGGADAWAVLERPRTIELVLRTCGLVAAVTACAAAIGLPAAWLVTRTDLPAPRIWSVLLALPLVIPSYVIALALIAAFGRGGMIARVVPGLEAPPQAFGFWGALAGLALATYPYVFLLVAGALRRSDRAVEEAARSLGRSRAQVFRLVTQPMLRPAIGGSALLVALYALSDFGVVSLMRFDALTRAIFLQYGAAFDRTPAAVLALVLVVLTTVVLITESRASRRAGARASSASARPAEPIPLGRWKAPAVAFLGLVVGAALVLPVAVLVWWLLRAASVGDAFSNVVGPGLNSLVASLLAAGVATLAALPAAILAVRWRGRWTGLVERASYAGNALPGVVIALALVFFAARYAEPLYGTLALLVIAYVIRFLPQALTAAGEAMRRADVRLEEAARGLGRGRLRTLLSVTAPLVTPTLLAGATLVFLSTMKELPATLLLRPIGFDTLATEVWTATGVSAYSQAAAPALTLIVLAAPAVWVFGARGPWGSLPRGSP